MISNWESNNFGKNTYERLFDGLYSAHSDRIIQDAVSCFVDNLSASSDNKSGKTAGVNSSDNQVASNVSKDHYNKDASTLNQIKELISQYKDVVDGLPEDAKKEYLAELAELIIETVDANNNKIQFVVVEYVYADKHKREVCIWGGNNPPIVHHWAKTEKYPQKLVHITKRFLACPADVKNYSSLATVVPA